MEESEGFSAEALPIFSQTAAAVQPSNRAFHDPAFRQNREALGLIGSLDDFDIEAATDPPYAGLERLSLVAAVRVELEQKGMKAEQRRHDPHAAVTVLDVARMQKRMQQGALRIYKDMALLAFDLLAGIVSRRIDRSPPFLRP